MPSARATADIAAVFQIFILHLPLSAVPVCFALIGVWPLVLFALDVGGLDDRPPFFNLGLLERSERFRRLLLARRNLLAEIGKAFADGRVGKSHLHGRSELCNDGLRRTLRHPKSVPD